jgi:hypothetical protein
VLARIVPEDPLGLRLRLRARLAERALLVDAERVLLRAHVLCALHAPTWRGDPELATWLDQRLDEALAAVLAEESAGEGRGLARALAAFAAPLALDAARLAAACARFNRLPLAQREAFFAVILDGAGAEPLASAWRLSLTDLARRVRAALELFRGERPGEREPAPGRTEPRASALDDPP